MTVGLANELVARGAALLDEKLPDWYNLINLDSLEMADECKCVLGQIGEHKVNLDRLAGEPLTEADGRHFWGARAALGCSDDDVVFCGFDDWATYEGTLTTYEELQAAWTREIEKRREVEAIMNEITA